MYTNIFSQSWYRVAQLKPKLRADAQWTRQNFRGEHWYVLRDATTGKIHRFSATAKLVLEKMDGQQSLHSIWEAVCNILGDDMPSQDEIIQLLAQLYRANLLHTDSLPDLLELSERKFREDRHVLWQYLKSPMALRLPLWNPDTFFKKIAGLAEVLFTKTTAVIFTLLLLISAFEVAAHWQALSNNFQDQAFSAGNWLLIALVYPFVKFLHELGHGLAIKRWGGNIRELGLMFLVFIPVPYVDASEASLFHRKHQRIIVSLAGIFTELTLACIALFLWVNAEPGIFRAILFNIMLIGGISTLLFNGNPLLKFDAYFALADFLELPNLAQRANQYIGYLIKNKILQQDRDSPANSKREACWFVGYGVMSFLYRLMVMFGIALFVASEYFFVGVILALWMLYQSLIAPGLRVVKNAWRDSVAHHYSHRLLLLTGFTSLFLLLAIAYFPLPHTTIAQGTYWAPEKAQIRADADCFVTELLVEADTVVQENDIIIRCESAQLRADMLLVKAQLAELQARYRALMNQDLNEAEILREEISRAEDELNYSQQRLDATNIRSNKTGIVRLHRYQDLPGKFVRRGSYLGYMDSQGVNQARIAIPQSAINSVRNDTQTLNIRQANNIFHSYSGIVLREIPQASADIPNAALTTEGGGDIVLDPRANEKAKALENWFQFDVETEISGNVGERIYVRFEHSSETLYQKLYRQIRRTFLKQFSV